MCCKGCATNMDCYNSNKHVIVVLVAIDLAVHRLPLIGPANNTNAECFKRKY